MGAPRKGQRGSPDPPGFRQKFSHIITVAPRVEIQMHFWKGAKFAGSVGHPMIKMLSASRRFRPPDQGLCPWTPDPRYRLVLRTRRGPPQPLTPSAAYVYMTRKVDCTKLILTCIIFRMAIYSSYYR